MKKYEQALASASVRNKVERAKKMTLDYKVEGTPTFAVQGRYVALAPASDVRGVLDVAEYLVERVRREPALNASLSR